jgi:hypothetical protein
MPVYSHSQYVAPCTEHSDCTVIVSETENEHTRELDIERGLPQGTTLVVQASHMHDSVDPAARLNPDYPDCADRRPGAKKGATITFRKPGAAEIASPHWPITAGDAEKLGAYADSRAAGATIQEASADSAALAEGIGTT